MTNSADDRVSARSEQAKPASPAVANEDDAVWRDEDKLPMSELSNAMASWDLDGQGDATDNDAGAEQAFGHGARVPDENDPDQTDPDREDRPSTTGRSGPH